jgi:glycosyltransferase involved in cell wall biosynthesis
LAGALRVVIPCDTFAPDINGAARFAERLAGGLVRRGHEVHIIAPAFDSSEGPRIEHHDGVNMIVHRLRSHRVPQHRTLRWPEPWGMTKKIFEVLKEVEPHAVHIQSHLMVGRFALRAAKKLNLRTLATNHVMPENLMRYSLLPKFLHKFAMRVIWADAGRILRKMDALTTPTKRAAELLEEAAGVTDVLAISCGIDASRFANQTPTQNANPVALFLGRLDDEKKIDVFLRAVAQLTDFPNLRVELVGDGGERERLQKLAESLKIASRVSFLGHVTDDELPGIYERATVFVMPSIAELQSIATMEAMASGRPVIAADAMALPHLVHDGDNGYLFPPGDVEALAERLRRVLAADKKELSRLSENSLHLIQSHDIQRTLGIFEDLYRGVGEPAPTTDDNKPAYMLPIGRLNDSVRERLLEWRGDALALRSRAEELTREARERLEDARDELRGQLSDLRKEVSKQAKKLRRRKD